MKNKGEKEIHFFDSLHRKKKLVFQITDVKKILISESKVCDAGHWIWRDEVGGAIVSKATGVETQFVRKGGVYVMELWIKEEIVLDGQGKEICSDTDEEVNEDQQVLEVQEKGRKKVDNDTEDEEELEEYERAIQRLHARTAFPRRVRQ